MPSQTLPQIVFPQLSRHSLAWLECRIKLTATRLFVTRHDQKKWLDQEPSWGMTMVGCSSRRGRQWDEEVVRKPHWVQETARMLNNIRNWHRPHTNSPQMKIYGRKGRLELVMITEVSLLVPTHSTSSWQGPTAGMPAMGILSLGFCSWGVATWSNPSP